MYCDVALLLMFAYIIDLVCLDHQMIYYIFNSYGILMMAYDDDGVNEVKVHTEPSVGCSVESEWKTLGDVLNIPLTILKSDDKLM